MHGKIKTLGTYWKLAERLSGSLSGQAWLFTGLVAVPLMKKIFGRRPIPIELTFERVTFRFYVRDGADIAALREVFLDGEYDFKLKTVPRAILELGAHVGAATVFFAIRYPQAAITAFEPFPQNFECLSRNVAGFRNVKAVEAAVSAKGGRVEISAKEGSSISASIVGTPDKTGVPVRSVTFAEALAEAGPSVDLVKFDIEGAEFGSIDACGMMGTVAAYVGEVHPDLAPASDSEGNFLAAFKGYDVSRKETGTKRYVMYALKK